MKLSVTQLAALRSIRDHGCMPITYDPALYSGVLRTGKSLKRLGLADRPIGKSWHLTEAGKAALVAANEPKKESP